MAETQPASWKCEKCGWPVWVEANFCSECGNALVAVERPDITFSSVKDFARGTVDEIHKGSRDALGSDTGKKMAAGAAIGGVVFAALPLVGWGAGAILGAGFVAYKRLTK